MTTATIEMTIPELISEAKTVARHAASKYFAEKMDNFDGGCCGFAWVTIYDFEGKKIRKNSKIGKALELAGVTKSWDGFFQIWNPSNFPCQNIDTLEEGARAAAELLKKAGFTAYAGSRLD
jgi:hypothetical protein